MSSKFVTKKTNWKRITYIALCFVLVMSMYYWHGGKAHAQTDTFTTSSTWTVPANVSSAVFEAWGGGGAGGGATGNNFGGSGGAGGQYAKTTLSGLVVNDIYTITVAASTPGTTANGSTGGDSGVLDPSSTTIVLAKGGAGGAADTGTPGSGSTTGGVGDVVYRGGNGSSGSNGQFGGGGGGGAGSSGAGGDVSFSASGGTGASANGGSGGTGPQATRAAGGNGSNYGGAGAGAYKTNGSSQSGGSGAQGLVTVTYTINTAPAAPTLISPASGATGVSTTPTFQLRTTDADNDSLKYKIVIYNPDCLNGAQTFDQTVDQTGWSGQDAGGGTAYTGSSVLSGSTIANFSGVTLALGTTYCWKAAAIDPAGTGTFGLYSATQLFTTASNSEADLPTLLSPASNATNVSTNPLFQLRTTDPDNDYLKYKIIIYSFNCATGVQVFDQTISQIGWMGQDQQSGTAYTGNSVLSSSTIAMFGLSNLSPNTTYCWKAAAIDPGGSNTFGLYSDTQLFTTGPANSGGVDITGGANITGGSYIR